MSVSNQLATALTVIFVFFIVALAGELLYVLWHRRSFRRHSSRPPPIRSSDETPDHSSTVDAATKELLYFFCLKPHTRVELDPSGGPNKRINGSSPEDQVVDVFKLLEANGPSKFLCTIKEEDKEDVESAPDVDFSNQLTTENSGEQTCIQLTEELAEEEEEVVVTVEGDDGNTKMVFSTPCDSPLFFTPAGSPARDIMDSEFVVSNHVTGSSNDS